MSNPSPYPGGNKRYDKRPNGEPVATFNSHPEARAAVNKLAQAEFPVQTLSIIGTNVITVERITGRMSWTRAAVAGLKFGIWVGIFFALFWLVTSPNAALLTLGAIDRKSVV